jgi:hypothetical protein
MANTYLLSRKANAGANDISLLLIAANDDEHV